MSPKQGQEFSEEDLDRVIAAVRKVVGDDELRGITLLAAVMSQALFIWTRGKQEGASAIMQKHLASMWPQFAELGERGTRAWMRAFSPYGSKRAS